MLITVNLAVAVCLVAAVSAFGYAEWRFGQIHTKSLSALIGSGAGGGSPFTLLVVGSDSRAALSNSADNAQFGGSASVTGQRSDTIILVRVVPAAHQLMMMSVPRDLWGAIPGHADNRINSAFDTGPNLLIQTIHQDLGVQINHYVEVNFDTFRDISNAVGGVSFYFPTAAKDPYSLLNIPSAGCYTLKGDQALAFVRARHYQYYQNGYWHSEGQSDLARIQRQQAFIKKMIKKSEGEFSNPIALNDIIGGVTKNLTVDTGFSPGLMLNLVKTFRAMNVAGIPNVTLPTYGYTTPGGAQVLGLQQPQASQAIAAFNAFGGVPAAKNGSKAKARSAPPVTAPKVTVAPSSVSVEVANGSGVAGQAGQMAQALTRLGYRAAVTTESTGYGHATTQILYAPDSLTAAEQLAAQVPGGATLASAPALTSTAYNVEVVTGASFAAGAGAGAGAVSPTTRAATPAAASTPATTVPGTNPAVYELPGAAPGQTPPANC